jgi:hypothetical protein
MCTANLSREREITITVPLVRGEDRVSINEFVESAQAVSETTFIETRIPLE